MPVVRVKQFPFVENPATVMLTPLSLGPSAHFWSYDGILLGGIEVNTKPASPEEPDPCRIAYMPMLVPRNWGEREFCVITEYEATSPTSRFKFRIYYGCGDPSELRLGETELLQGSTNGKQRMSFRLNEKLLARAELFRVTLEVVRESSDKVLVYGSWLEVNVE